MNRIYHRPIITRRPITISFTKVVFSEAGVAEAMAAPAASAGMLFVGCAEDVGGAAADVDGAALVAAAVVSGLVGSGSTVSISGTTGSTTGCTGCTSTGGSKRPPSPGAVAGGADPAGAGPAEGGGSVSVVGDGSVPGGVVGIGGVVWSPGGGVSPSTGSVVCLPPGSVKTSAGFALAAYDCSSSAEMRSMNTRQMRTRPGGATSSLKLVSLPHQQFGTLFCPV